MEGIGTNASQISMGYRKGDLGLSLMAKAEYVVMNGKARTWGGYE